MTVNPDTVSEEIKQLAHEAMVLIGKSADGSGEALSGNECFRVALAELEQRAVRRGQLMERDAMKGMGHPTPEQLDPLLKAVDTFVWCWSVKEQTRRGTRVKVDWKSSIEDLKEAYSKYEVQTDPRVMICSGDGPKL